MERHGDFRPTAKSLHYSDDFGLSDVVDRRQNLVLNFSRSVGIFFIFETCALFFIHNSRLAESARTKHKKQLAHDGYSSYPKRLLYSLMRQNCEEDELNFFSYGTIVVCIS